MTSILLIYIVSCLPFIIIGVALVWIILNRVMGRKGNQKEYEIEINKNTIILAACSIEAAAKFVKANQFLLNSNLITMWQLDNVGDGFIIEFYGHEAIFRSEIERLIKEIYGQWRVFESNDGTLHIQDRSGFSYKGSWNKFNEAVWDEVKRNHPEWKIEKQYSHKYVLYI